MVPSFIYTYAREQVFPLLLVDHACKAACLKTLKYFTLIGDSSVRHFAFHPSDIVYISSHRGKANSGYQWGKHQAQGQTNEIANLMISVNVRDLTRPHDALASNMMRFGLPGALFAFILNNRAAVEKVYCLVHSPLKASDVPPFQFDDLRPFAVNRFDPLYTSKVRGWLSSWGRTKAELIKQLGSWDSSRLSPKDIVLYKQVLVTIPHTTTGPQVDLTDAQTKSLYDDF